MQGVGAVFSRTLPSRQRLLTACPFRIRPAHRRNEKQDLSHRQRLFRGSSTPYAAGLLFRLSKRVAGMGVDSLAVLVLYALGVAGLFAIATT
jgi:hypothetical protein